MSHRFATGEDVHYRGTLSNLRIGLGYVVATRVANEAVLRHNCDPLSAHLLGRALGASFLLSGGLAPEERYNLRWQYQGCVRTLLLDVGGDGTVRGFISPTDLSAHGGSKQEFFGDGGQISVVRSREGQVLNSGTVQSILQDVVDDLTFYLSVSDQVETVMTVLIAFNADPKRPVNLCRGLMLQALPDTDMAQFERIREELAHPRVRALLAQPAEPDSLIATLVNGLVREEIEAPGLEYKACAPPRFHCTCNREKMDMVVRSLSYADRMDILQKGEALRINCQFCNHQYVMTLDDCRTAWTGRV